MASVFAAVCANQQRSVSSENGLNVSCGVLIASFKYDKKMETSIHKMLKKMKEKGLEWGNAKDASFYACPSGVGLHISIGKNVLDREISFVVERTMVRLCVLCHCSCELFADV